MELTERVALVALSTSEIGLAQHLANNLRDAEAPCFSMVLVHRRRFVWH